jgi:mRNA interferase YafQ
MRISQGAQFKNDIKLQRKRGKDLRKLSKVIDLLLESDELPVCYKDHQLKGVWLHRKDCHIEPDWILIYRRTDDELRLERTGSHSDLF